MIKKRLLLTALAATLCPLSWARDISASWKVSNGPKKQMKLDIFQAENINFTLTTTDFNLSSADAVVWEIVGWTDYTNAYCAVTGTVSDAASGRCSFVLTPEQSNLESKSYRGFVRAMQLDGNEITRQTVLAHQYIHIEWSPDSRNYAMVGPLTTPLVYNTATVDAIEASLNTQISAVQTSLQSVSNQFAAALASIPPDTDTQLTETQVDDFVANNGFATTAELTAAIASATPENYDSVSAAALSAIQSEIDPAWHAGTNAIYSAIANATDTNAVSRDDLDGDWFYPAWFDWSFEAVPIDLPDSSSLSTNNDVIVATEIYNSSATDYSIDWSNMRCTNELCSPVVTSADESVAVISDGSVHYVAAGTATITATLGDFSRTAPLEMSVYSLTKYIVQNVLPGSAAAAFSSGITSRQTDGSDKAVYSVYDHSTPHYVRNQDSWVAGIDLTCVSPWNSYGGRTRAGTLIGSDCMICAYHYPIPVGTTVRFVTADNRIIERTVLSRSGSSAGDYMVERLSSPIDAADITPAMMVPDDYTDYMPYPYSYQTARLVLWVDQFEQAYSGALRSMDAISYTDSLTYFKGAVPGDSGSPVLLVTDDAGAVPIFVGTYWWAGGGIGSNARYSTKIRTVAESLGCDMSSIRSADFAALGFTKFILDPPTLGQ